MVRMPNTTNLIEWKPAALLSDAEVDEHGPRQDREQAGVDYVSETPFDTVKKFLFMLSS